MEDFRAQKDRARRDARTRRRVAAQANPSASAQAAEVFLEAVPHQSCTCVALYRAIQSELDPEPLVRALRRRGAMICFPVVTAPDTPLEFRAAEAETSFVPGAFGADIPADGSPVVFPTVVVTPLLAWDRHLYRLGYGGGFYDRTLEMLRAERPILAFGFAYTAQEMETVPIEETDQKLDGVVTESRIFS